MTIPTPIIGDAVDPGLKRGRPPLSIALDMQPFGCIMWEGRDEGRNRALEEFAGPGYGLRQGETLG